MGFYVIGSKIVSNKLSKSEEIDQKLKKNWKNTSSKGHFFNDFVAPNQGTFLQIQSL